MIPFPKTDIDEIIMDLVNIEENFDIEKYRHSLKAYKKKGSDLLKKEPVKGFILLGIISCVERDEEKMHSYHKTAIKSSDGSFLAYSQYATSLSNFDLPSAALKYAKKAYLLDQSNRKLLILLMRTSHRLGFEKEYKKYKDQLIKLKFEFNDPDAFCEDDEKTLDEMIQKVDTFFSECPNLIVEQDPDFEKFVDELVDGVDL